MCGSCDEANPCTTDRCTATGCVNDPLTGPACDDGNACTTGDTCSAGTCGGSALQCPAPSACHVQGVCDPSTGQCTAPLAPDGSACNDGDACTAVDHCTAGTCAGTTVQCPSPGTCRVQGVCSPATGVCSTPLAPTNSSCDDADASTHTDVCSATGTCTGTPVACPASTACTTYAPNGTASCTVTQHDGATCDDANACTPPGTCASGACVVGAPVTCVNGGTCNNGPCTCTAGWTGPTCATDVNECAALACGGGSSCTNSPGSYACQCLSNYNSPDGASCTSTVPTLEVVLFYDEGVARLYGDQARARLASMFDAAKAPYDGSLLPALTLSLNAVVRVEPMPSAISFRACNTLQPNTTCTGCYTGGFSGSCGTLRSTLATEVDPEELLSSFSTWVQSRRAALQSQLGTFDLPILVTTRDFASSVVGLATVSSACRTYGAAIISLSSSPGVGVGGTLLAHEIGHTLGMSHDPSGSAWVMTPSSSEPSPSAFSSQSNSAFTTWRNQLGTPNAPNCVADFASSDWALKTCGNGVVDDGEACDPGPNADSCCTSTCQLAAGCACANTEPCCDAGTPRAAGTTCRAARTECDLADTCDGVTGACRDTYKSPREACTNNGLCLRGECASRLEQCRAPAPPGSQYETATGCETSTSCTRLECNLTNACDFSWFITPKNGTRCGLGNQCVSGLCVPSLSLKDYGWASGAWSACTNGSATRPVSCLDEAGAMAPSAMCDPDTMPAATKSCP